MADPFSTFNGYEVKDSYARDKIKEMQSDVQNLETDVQDLETNAQNLLSGKNVVILGDSNAALYQATGFLESSAVNVTVQKLAVGGATFRFRDNGIDSIDQFARIEGTPDYILIWFGGNDIATMERGTVGFPKYKSINEEDFDNSTTFGALNFLLCKIRKKYPKTKIIGLIRTYHSLFDEHKNRFMWHVINKLYQKWSVPVINLELTGNIYEGLEETFNSQFADHSHYNNETFSDINKKIVGAINSGLNCSCEIPCDTYYHDSDENLILGSGAVRGFLDVLAFENGNTFEGRLVTIFSLGNTSYIQAQFTSANGEAVNAIQMRASNEVLAYHHYANGKTDTYHVLKYSRFSEGNVLDLPTGDYLIFGNDITSGLVTGLPEGVTRSCNLSVKDCSLLGQATWKILNLTEFGGKFFAGSAISNTDFVWFEK